MAAAPRRRAGTALLALLGPRAPEAAGLTGDEWRLLDTIAGEHRLRPHLHGRYSRGEIALAVPDAIADGWRAAHRDNAIAMLGQRRSLIVASRLLAAHGIDSVALKGAALAWTVWPTPAERPMRDVDLLLPETRVIEGWHLLRAAGWEGPDQSTEELGAAARNALHLPLLRSPEGVACELHARAWLPLGDAETGADPAAVLARAVPLDETGCAHPAADDMLAHLIVHATYSHRFNAGPLVLADMAFCLDTAMPDWPDFWLRARREGWLRGAACTLALVDRWCCPGILAQSNCPEAVDPALVDAACDLLVQPVQARQDIAALAALQERGGNRSTDGPVTVTRTQGRSLRHVAGRALSLAGSLLDPETRRAGRQTATVSDWLSGG